jgi:glycosyltransferase involved in cell wall biosynthesis
MGRILGGGDGVGEPVSVVVGILTFRRPEMLSRLLPRVLDQLDRLPSGTEGAILVIDNDPAASAREATAAFGEPVRYVHEPSPGIAAARQRCLLEAMGYDLLQFIDDDEEPVADWLTSMVTAWRTFARPAAVAGRVLPRYAVPPSEWIIAGGFFVRGRHPSGTELDAAPAGNLLLDVHQVQELGAAFDPGLGLHGGEDTLFTRDLVAHGGRIVFNDDAAISDLVPAERLTREWVLRRAWFHGSTAADLRLRRAAPRTLGRVRIRLVVGGVARVVVGCVRATAGFLLRNPGLNARGWRLAYRGLGVIAGGAGRTQPEYGRGTGAK